MKLDVISVNDLSIPQLFYWLELDFFFLLNQDSKLRMHVLWAISSPDREPFCEGVLSFVLY